MKPTEKSTPGVRTRPTFARVVLGLFCTLNALMLFLFLMHLPFALDSVSLSVRGWSEAQPRISIVAGLAACAGVAYWQLASRLKDAWKTRLLFFKRDQAHPGHQAFYSIKEPPFDRQPLLKRYPEVRDSAYDPEVQFRTWRGLLAKHAATPLVAGALVGWRLMRELFLVALAAMLVFLVAWPLNGGVLPVVASSYLFVYAAQLLFLVISGQSIGKRLVYSVLAVELGVEDEFMKRKPRHKKKGKRF